MLSSEVVNPAVSQGKLSNFAEFNEADPTHEASLDRAIEAMEEEAKKYHQAGLTHVSTWLE